MKYLLIFIFIMLLVACSPQTQTPPEWEREGWTLIWQDEFDGEAIDPNQWEMEIGGHGWGNNEWQFYTYRPENVRLEDGLLVIEARDEKFIRRNYTSGRLKTQGLFTFTYGRVEARMKLPYGQGLWPAFWMLGEDIDYVGWPSSGEIDIMEHIGRQPTHIYGTVHGPGYSGAGGVGHFTTFPAGTLSEEFHVYAIEWEPGEIRWYVDDNQFFKLMSDQVPGEWVYDHPFFILINLAVGGNWPGYPDDSTIFPQFLYVDYVRVYQRPEMAAEYQNLRGGPMHVGDIQISVIDATHGWQALASVTVMDEDGNPVSDAKVVGGWVGTVTKGETSALTDVDGTVKLLSDITEKSGEITFCVNNVSRNGYTYDKTANVRNCAKVDH
ncbi:MAG: family 16 glycosylhydrolase [Methanoregula sp.]|nr:family 16 glycosylhydrolase [Methanoregula sp.]